MGIKIFITGAAFMFAFNPILKAVGLAGNDVFVLVGAVLMILGTVLVWLNK